MAGLTLFRVYTVWLAGKPYRVVNYREFEKSKKNAPCVGHCVALTASGPTIGPMDLFGEKRLRGLFT
jgi:hypothetical protein